MTFHMRSIFSTDSATTSSHVPTEIVRMRIREISILLPNIRMSNISADADRVCLWGPDAGTRYAEWEQHNRHTACTSFWTVVARTWRFHKNCSPLCNMLDSVTIQGTVPIGLLNTLRFTEHFDCSVGLYESPRKAPRSLPSLVAILKRFTYVMWTIQFHLFLHYLIYEWVPARPAWIGSFAEK